MKILLACTIMLLGGLLFCLHERNKQLDFNSEISQKQRALELSVAHELAQIKAAFNEHMKNHSTDKN